jgi:hypothetical protein
MSVFIMPWSPSRIQCGTESSSVRAVFRILGFTFASLGEVDVVWQLQRYVRVPPVITNAKNMNGD